LKSNASVMALEIVSAFSSAWETIWQKTQLMHYKQWYALNPHPSKIDDS
jgi:hypothetical protein